MTYIVIDGRGQLKGIHPTFDSVRKANPLKNGNRRWVRGVGRFNGREFVPFRDNNETDKKALRIVFAVSDAL